MMRKTRLRHWAEFVQAGQCYASAVRIEKTWNCLAVRKLALPAAALRPVSLPPFLFHYRTDRVPEAAAYLRAIGEALPAVRYASAPALRFELPMLTMRFVASDVAGGENGSAHGATVFSENRH